MITSDSEYRFTQDKWNLGTLQVQVQPPPGPLIKIKNGEKSDKVFVIIKLRRDTMSEKSDLYEFKMDLFDNREHEQFLMCVRNFTMIIEEL